MFRSHFCRIRFDPVTMLVNTRDFTYADNQGATTVSYGNIRHGPHEHVPYARSVLSLTFSLEFTESISKTYG